MAERTMADIINRLPTPLALSAGPVVGMRWNNGILEQGIQTIFYEAGTPIKSEIVWSRVPIHEE